MALFLLLAGNVNAGAVSQFDFEITPPKQNSKCEVYVEPTWKKVLTHNSMAGCVLCGAARSIKKVFKEHHYLITDHPDSSYIFTLKGTLITKARTVIGVQTTATVTERLTGNLVGSSSGKAIVFAPMIVGGLGSENDYMPDQTIDARSMVRAIRRLNESLDYCYD